MHNIANCKMLSRAALVLSIALLPVRANAQVTLYVAQSQGGYTSNGFGGSRWNFMTAQLNSAFGTGNVSTFADLNNLSTLLSYDRLWVDQRYLQSFTGTEVSNIAAFLATGKRAVLIGENYLWAPWNAQIGGLVGGTVTDGCDFGSSATVFSNALTAGVSTVYDACGSLAVGGTALFSTNFATLWGSQLSTLTILDSNLMDDTYRMNEDNTQFASNTAQWLAGGSVVATPEPASMMLLGTGLLAIGAVVRRRRVS